MWIVIGLELAQRQLAAVVLIAPGAGALGLIWAIAAYSIVFGITFIALALRLKNHRHAPAAA